MPRIVYQRGGNLVVYGKPAVQAPSITNTIVVGSGGNDLTLTPQSVPFAGNDGKLTEDNTGLYYNGTNLNVGHNNPGAYSGISVNGGRGGLFAAQAGLILSTGVASNGAFDTTKHIQVLQGFNTGANIYFDIYSTGAGPYVHHFYTPLLVANNFANDAAAAAGSILVGEWYHNAGALRIRIA